VEYTFGIRESKIRHDTFSIVTMNEEELGFTTDLGKDWEMWQAYRELYCNVIDEGGECYRHDPSQPFTTVESETYVFVKGKAIDEAYENRNQYFMSDEKILQDDSHAQAFNGNGRGVFFRGIRVAQAVRPLQFNYNFMQRESFSLTEDRTMKYPHQMTYNVQALIQQSTNEKFLRACLTAGPDTFEGNLDYRERCRNSIKVGDTFMDVVGELRHELKDNGINISAMLIHKRKVQHSILPTKSCELNVIEKKQLKKAFKFVHKTLGLELRKFPLIVCEDLGIGGLGRADMESNIMYISKACFSQGTKTVAKALLEEFTHLDKRVLDETLEQKHVYLELILSLGERLAGEPL
jgi:hypothetical protein